MRWLLVAFFLFLFPELTLAKHFPPEIGFLNQLRHVGDVSCTDPETAVEGVCQVLIDPGTGAHYFAIHRRGRLWKVWRVERGVRTVVWQASLNCDEELCA